MEELGPEAQTELFWGTEKSNPVRIKEWGGALILRALKQWILSEARLELKIAKGQCLDPVSNLSRERGPEPGKCSFLGALQAAN